MVEVQRGKVIGEPREKVRLINQGSETFDLETHSSSYQLTIIDEDMWVKRGKGEIIAEERLHTATRLGRVNSLKEN